MLRIKLLKLHNSRALFLTVLITDLEDITKLITNQTLDDRVQRYRSSFLYRGLFGTDKFTFCTRGEDLSGMDKHNCVIWQIDIEELNRLLPKKFQDMLKRENAFLFTTDMLEKLINNLEKYDDEMKNAAIVLIEPPSINQRIINQYLIFLLYQGKLLI